MLSQNIADMGQKYGQMESRITERLNNLELQSNKLGQRVEKLSGRQHERMPAATVEDVDDLQEA